MCLLHRSFVAMLQYKPDGSGYNILGPCTATMLSYVQTHKIKDPVRDTLLDYIKEYRVKMLNWPKVFFCLFASFLQYK